MSTRLKMIIILLITVPVIYLSNFRTYFEPYLISLWASMKIATFDLEEFKNEIEMYKKSKELEQSDVEDVINENDDNVKIY